MVFSYSYLYLILKLICSWLMAWMSYIKICSLKLSVIFDWPCTLK
jgi:hypothetical protein